MNWSRREMSAESVASTNEPSSGGRGPTFHRKRHQQPMRTIHGSGSSSSNNNNHPHPHPHHHHHHHPESTSLPAYYLAHSLVASLMTSAAAGSSLTAPLSTPTTDSEHADPRTQLRAIHQHNLLPPEAAESTITSQMAAAQQQQSPLILLEEQQQQSSASSFSDWWDEYWSRQPFPSGYTQSSITLLACFISTIIFLIVVGNLLVCIAIFTEKSLKPTQNWFIASLAVSDMLLGLVVMPFSLARELMGFWVFGPLWCDIHEAVDVLLTTASINTLCLISLDRYWSITQAVSYLKKRTPRRGAFMIAFVWVFSAAVSLPPLFGWKKQQIPIVVPSKQPSTTTTTATTTNQLNQTEPSSDQGRGKLTNSLDYDNELDSSSTAQSEGRNRRRRGQFAELATPILVHRRETFAGEDMEAELIGKTSSITAPSRQLVPMSPADQQAATLLSDYPTCQLSDDLGYVLYSALGSFYIPCAVMVFTYIKIFLAARSRARRAISKQGRGGGANKRAASAAAAAAAASKRAASAGSAAGTKQQLAVQQGCNASTISGQVTSYAGSLSHNESSLNDNHDDHHQHGLGLADGPASRAPAPIIQGGKIVIVERKKSLAAANLLGGQQQTTSSSLAAIQAAAQRTAAAKMASSEEVDAEQGRSSAAAATAKVSAEQQETKEENQCTLTTSGVKQASQSALNSSASNDSSMITVMHSSMAEVPPVTRFNFRDPTELPDARAAALRQQRVVGADEDEGSRKAAALLEAIRQVGAHEQHLVSEVLDESGDDDDGNDHDKDVPDIVVERRGTSHSTTGPQQNENQPAAAGENNCCSGASGGLNATSETCFMTIEEDSDMFESQTGRTITMVAANASQRQTSSLAKNQSTIVTMMPASQHSTTVCSDAACRGSSAHRGPSGGAAARSVSSYCGSSMTINDEDDDDDDDDEDDEDDIDDCDEDDEPLTDECNGYSCSAYDHYCPDQDLSSACGHCQECEQDERQAAAIGDAPVAGSNARAHHLSAVETVGLSPTRKQTRHHHHHHNNQQQQHQRKQNQKNQHDSYTAEAQSITGDDNLSLTEYRSNEDDENSSIIGHDVLDATDSTRRRDRGAAESKKKQSVSGPATNERKKSSIGFRLARLGSSAPLSNCGGGLIALASSTQQQQQQQQSGGGGTRNLKALRQNFFLKLNQLTAKSATKQHEIKSKKAGSTSPTGGKSSAQSSGTSYEPSVDYATTSNIHSNEYPLETTIGDESEQHSSSEQAKIMLKQQSNEGHNRNKKDLITNGPDVEDDEYEKSSLPTSETARAATDSVKFARHGDKTILLKNSNNSNPTMGPRSGTDLDDDGDDDGDDNDGAKHKNINQMVGRISSGLVSTSKSAAAVGVGAAGLGKSQRFDLDSNNNQHSRHHHEPSGATSMGGGTAGGGGGKKRPIGGHSSTMMSSSAGSGQPAGGQRIYLASDNERHKRKLAKARERRATLILGLIMATFICSWLPFFTFYVLRAICSSCKENVSPRFEAFIFWMGYCNSAINPIIYTIFNRDFRKAFRKILFKCL